MLRRFLFTVPRSCLLLIVAGSPCPQLTSMGSGGGELGITGRDSVAFHAVPLIIWLINHMRPDLVVHTVLENAGSMLPRYREYIMHALGIQGRSELAPLIRATRYSPFRRDRFFFSTLPASRRMWHGHRRGTPWEPGFSAMSEVMPAMMKGRQAAGPHAGLHLPVCPSLPGMRRKLGGTRCGCRRTDRAAPLAGGRTAGLGPHSQGTDERA